MAPACVFTPFDAQRSSLWRQEVIRIRDFRGESGLFISRNQLIIKELMAIYGIGRPRMDLCCSWGQRLRLARVLERLAAAPFLALLIPSL
jgi:hypothetical protein